MSNAPGFDPSLSPPPQPRPAPGPAPAPAPAIRVRHLWHRFGRFDVLRDVSFDVAHGEIFGFIGPNGAGKTTTIRVMATLLEPLAGRVEVDGLDVTIDPERVRKMIGYMPDHAGVYDRVTVREYLEFFADAYRVPTAGTTYAVVDAVMELTDLTKLREKLVATMSKGMKQRLQLARTLLHDPKVLILDEPASDLDPRARIEIRDLLVELRSMGKTVFLSSHILTELADVCTSVAILERGRLVVAGPIHDIARRLEMSQAQQQQQQQEQYQQQQQQHAQQHAQQQQQHAQQHPHQQPYQQQQPHPMQPGMGMPPGAYDPTMGHAHGQQMPPAPPMMHVAKRRAKLKALAPPEAVAAALTGMPTVLKVSPGPGGTVIVTHTGDDQALAMIVRAVVMAGVPVAGVEPERNELERIFLEVTKGEVQ